MKYNCPVCGYDSLPAPPADYKICPFCGTEFGYDDLTHSSDVLRDRWLAKGGRWFSDHTPAPPRWNAIAQLEAAGLLSNESATRHPKG